MDETKIAYYSATSQTILFSDSVRIELPFDQNGSVRATENFFIQGPQDFRFLTAPGTHFRHSGLANVVFLDGHVASHEGPANVPLPGHWPGDALELAERIGIGYLTKKSTGDSLQGIKYHD